MKKIISLLLSIVGVLSLLTACGDPSDTTETSKKEIQSLVINGGSSYSGDRKGSRRAGGIRRTFGVCADHAGQPVRMRRICQSDRKNPCADPQL